VTQTPRAWPCCIKFCGSSVADLDARARQTAVGFQLTRVPALEVLVWTEAESQGYYRGGRR
jgi:hypothetical protein